MPMQTPCLTDDNKFLELSADGPEDTSGSEDCASVTTTNLRRCRRSRRNRAHEKMIDPSHLETTMCLGNSGEEENENGSVAAAPSFNESNTSSMGSVTKYEGVHGDGFDGNDEALKTGIVGSIRECLPMQAPEILNVGSDCDGEDNNNCDSYKFCGGERYCSQRPQWNADACRDE